MIIIGVDFHPEFQQSAFVDTDTGEFQEKRLAHRGEAEQLQFGLWIGNAAEIQSKRERSNLQIKQQGKWLR